MPSGTLASDLYIRPNGASHERGGPIELNPAEATRSRPPATSCTGALMSSHGAAVTHASGTSQRNVGGAGWSSAVNTRTSCPNSRKYFAVLPTRTAPMLLYGGKKNEVSRMRMRD